MSSRVKTQLDRNDLAVAPFDDKDGLGRMCKLLGDEMDELNGAIAA